MFSIFRQLCLVPLLLLAATISFASPQDGPGAEALGFVRENPVPAHQAGPVVGESETGLYIVHLKDAPLARYSGEIPGLAATSPRATGARGLDLAAPESLAYRAYLEGVQSRFVSAMDTELHRSVSVRFHYMNVLNAVAVELDHQEALRLAAMPEVLAVYPDTLRDLDTDTGPELMGAPDFWEGAHGLGENRGEGVIVGVLDTGINPEHPSFAPIDGDGYSHVNPLGSLGYLGVCNPDETSQVFDPICNDKLIGAWSFINGPNSGASARDWDSHGSHVAGTIAGNRHTATVRVGADTYRRLLSGVAPRANIIAYQVCDPRCPTSSALAAVNQAVQDGVRVLNYSISGGDAPWSDPVDLAFLDAYAAGMSIIASAGNDGPDPKTVAKTGPWNASVAAGTHNRIIANAVNVIAPLGRDDLQNLAAVPGEGISLEADIERPILWSGQADPDNVLGCDPFPDQAFMNAVALIQRGNCTYSNKIENAHAAGAAGVIVYNNLGGPPITMGSTQDAPIPAFFLDITDGQRLAECITANESVMVRINKETSLIFNDTWQNLVAGFSSRGPSRWDLLKPDFAAPGVNILAAGHAGPEAYVFMQGTSMASPHAAGAAALLRQRHPDWTPAEIKSALALTAWPNLRDTDGINPADVYGMGSGRIDLTQAALVGLVMDETVANYRAANPVLGGSPKILNQPGMVDLQCRQSCSWTRTVRSVLETPATFTAWVQAPDGMTVTVTPRRFAIAPGASQELRVTVEIENSRFPNDPWVAAQVRLEADAANVAVHRLPVIVLGTEHLPPWETEIGVINPDPTLAMTGDLRGLDAAGSVVWSLPMELPGHGRVELNVAEEAGDAAAGIRAMRLDIANGRAVGYQKFFRFREYRAGVEALSRASRGELHLPLIQTEGLLWTGIGLLNTTEEEKNLEFAFSDLSTVRRDLAARAHDAFPAEELKAGWFEGAAGLSGGSGVSGLLLLGTTQQLHGTSLRDVAATDLVFPHLAQNDMWWTAYAIYNPGQTQADIDLVAYDNAGNPVLTQPGFARIPARKNSINEIDLPAQAAWVRLESSTPVVGYLAFGLTSGMEIAGYTATGPGLQHGVFPKLEPYGWTGIAFVNDSDSANQVRLSARDNDGAAMATTTVNLEAGEKWVGLSWELFPTGDISEATYVSFEADAPVVGFQLNGYSDGTMLDALPILGSELHVGGTTLYFPHIAAE